jgi:hypothetical protein
LSLEITSEESSVATIEAQVEENEIHPLFMYQTTVLRNLKEHD